MMAHAAPLRLAAAPAGMSYGQLVLAVLMAGLLAALPVQLVVRFDAVNVGSASIVFASSAVMLAYLAWTPAIHTHPVSTFTLLGFNVTTQMGALLGQSAFGVPIADNLRQPLETFGWLAAFQFVALATHAFYRGVFAPPDPGRPGLIRATLLRLGLYTPPGTGTLWLMGYVGLFAFVVGSGREGVFAKTLQGMSFMAWAPFLIPMYLLQLGETYSRWSRQVPQLVFFAGLVVLLGLAVNSRGVMLAGFMTVSLFALLLLLRSRERVRWRRVGVALLALGLLSLAAIPVSDLATAMVVARKARGSISAVEMVSETFRIVVQPDLLAAERAEKAGRVNTRYDERYFDNPLLARLVETKFHDNSLYFTSTYTDTDRDELGRRTLDMFIITLPTPVLKRLGFDLDKKDYQHSMGDLLAHLSYGGPLGGYRTGSMPAHGLALFGPGYLAVYALLCLGVFLLLDLLTARRADGVILVSAVGMLSLWDFFLTGVTAESIQSWLTYYLRYLPQSIVLFLIVAAIGKAFAWLLGGYAVKPRATPARRAPV